MAVKLNNTTIIDNTKNALAISSITYPDTSVQTTAAIGEAQFISHQAKSLLATLDNPNVGVGNAKQLGFSVAVDGDYAIVGAPYEDDAGGTDSGKAYIFDVTTGALVHTLNNPNAYSTSASDRFGQSVAISGNYAIVGAYQEGDAGGTYSGKTYIFDVTTGALVWTLNNPNAHGTSADDYFGNSVAISGDYAIVSALGEDDAGGTTSGKAYIFNVTTGALVWTLNNPNAYDTSANDYFGRSVAISGNYAIVGAYYEDDAGGPVSGKAYIFNVTTGALVQTLNNPTVYGTSANDYFGISVAISGNYAIVGAYLEDDVGGSDSGKAYIFNAATGALVHTLNNPNAHGTSVSDNFGYSVAISGNYAIVGAYYEDDAGGTSSGKAYIFDVTTGALLWTLNNPTAYGTSVNDNFGYSVAISGNYAIVGAHQEDDINEYSAGKAYVFNSGVFAKVLTANSTYGTSSNDNFGISAAISGNYAIVGAYYEDDVGGASSGKAYIFNVTTGALVWALDNPNAYNTSADDNFGYSVAISGNYAIVGAYNEDDAGGSQSGKAYIFNVTTGALVQTLNNPNAYSTSANDYFGQSVAISGDYAIVGVYQEDDVGGASSGKAYIFNVTTGTLLWTLDNPTVYGTSVNDNFGSSVAISGNYAIVGAYQEDDAGGANSGKAYIFNVTTGALVRTLNNPNAYGTSTNDNFGRSVAISGDYAIVGASSEDDAGGSVSGKAYIFNVTTGALVWTLNNPNTYSTSASDWFGWSVTISGNYAIVGAYYEDDAGGSESGKAYIFNVTTGELVHTLNNPNAYSTSANDYFGNSIAISGNYAIVGANAEDDAAGSGSGKAYIFNIDPIYDLASPDYAIEEIEFTNSYTMNLQTDKLFQTAYHQGQLVRTIDNPNAYSTSAYDNFGISVAISGNYAIVSAPYEDDAGGSESGKAYIFNVTTGALLWTLDNPNAYNTSAYDYFGTSVAISGNYAIVGAYNEDDAGGLDSGKAYIFNVTTGALVWTLDNPNAYDTSADDYFGTSVAISGNYVIVGAYGAGDTGGSWSGKAYIFNVTTGALVQTLNNPNTYSTSANDTFGSSVAISGNYAIVSAPYEGDAGGSGSGKAYIFNVTTGALVQTLNNPNAYDTSAYDNFGYSVAISGNYAIVSAQCEGDAGGSESGKAYIFNVTTGALLWTLNNPNAYSTSESDWFGSSVAISGNYAIVSAYGEGDAGGSSSGKAYIFNVTTGALVWTLNNPNAYDTSANDYFGYSVAISGNYAIVSAPYEGDAGGSESGKAYMFAVKDLTYIDKILTVTESLF